MDKYLQTDRSVDFFKNIWQEILNVLPNLLLAIVFILVAWLFIKIILVILKRILKAIKVDSLMTKLNEFEIFGKKKFDVVPSKLILEIVRYLLILTFVIIAADILNLHALSRGISKFIAYLPILLSALAIFVIGVYIASVIRKAVAEAIKSFEMTGSKLISNMIFYLIVIFITITALNQAGINTEIITKNIILLVGAILVSFTIAFGLGARDVVQRLLFGFYSKRNFQVGQHTIKEFVNQKIEIIK